MAAGKVSLVTPVVPLAGMLAGKLVADGDDCWLVNSVVVSMVVVLVD